MSSYEKLRGGPTYNPGNRSVIRVPRSVQRVIIEVYVPNHSAQRVRQRQSAYRLGVSREAFDRDRVDWRRYRFLEDAERDGFIEVIPEEDGGKLIVLGEHLVNVILS